MSSDSRRTSRCFSWMSLNQSTSMSSSRLSGSQMRTEARAGSSSHSPQGEGLPPALGPARQALPGARTVHSPTQLLLQLDPAVLQGIQLALNGVHLPVDVILGDVLVSLDLLDSTPVTKRTSPSPPACLLPGALPFLQPALATTGPGPSSVPRPSGARCGIPVWGRVGVQTAATPPCPWLQHGQAHPEGGTTPSLPVAAALPPSLPLPV